MINACADHLRVELRRVRSVNPKCPDIEMDMGIVSPVISVNASHFLCMAAMGSPGAELSTESTSQIQE